MLTALKDCATELQRLRDVHLPKYEGKVGEPDADVLKRAKEAISEPLCALTYTEGHPDRERTFLGIFSSEDNAKVIMREHMAQEQARLPHASIREWHYTFDETTLDERAW